MSVINKGLVSICLAGLAFSSYANTTDMTEEEITNNASYSVGHQVALTLRKLIDRTEEKGTFTFNEKKVIEGMQDAMAGYHKLTSSEMEEALKYIDDMEKTKKENAINATYNDGASFQREYARKEGVKGTQSGLLYKLITPGLSNETPKEDSIVTLEYTGKTIDGTVFDSSEWRTLPSRILVANLASGFKEGVELMTMGSEYEFVIKPELAYQDKKQPNIPAMSTLIYKVKLVQIEN